MNPEIKEQWANALLSGDYEQGQNVLRKEDTAGNVTWCCLGVLCDLAVKAGVELSVTTEEETYSAATITAYDGDSTYPPQSVVRWADLPSPNPAGRMVGSSDDEQVHSNSLAGMNDHGIPFTEIAEAIRVSL